MRGVHNNNSHYNIEMTVNVRASNRIETADIFRSGFIKVFIEFKDHLIRIEQGKIIK